MVRKFICQSFPFGFAILLPNFRTINTLNNTKKINNTMRPKKRFLKKLRALKMANISQQDVKTASKFLISLVNHEDLRIKKKFV